MRKRIGFGPANGAAFEANAHPPHPMLEPPRMIRAGQPKPASHQIMEELA